MMENFGIKMKRQEMVAQFFKLHEEEEKTYTETVDSYFEIRDNLEDFAHFDGKTLSHIRVRLEARTNCPLCQNELFNEEIEDKYCPVCYDE